MNNVDKAIQLAGKLQNDIEKWYIEQEKNIRELREAIEQFRVNITSESNIKINIANPKGEKLVDDRNQHDCHLSPEDGCEVCDDQFDKLEEKYNPSRK